MVYLDSVGEDDGTLAGVSAQLSFLERENADLRRRLCEAAGESDASASEDRLRLAVEATGIALWSLDVTTGALEWSPRMKEIMGRTEPLGDEAYLLAVHPEDRELARAVYERLRGGDDTAWMRHRIVRPDGEVRWVVPAGKIIRAPSGEPVRVIGGYLDVTELHHLEERVRHAERMEALGTLTSGVAHNLNNLLAVIQPTLELANAHVSEEGSALIDDALIAAKRASRVVRQLMAFAGRTHAMQSKIVPLTPLIRSALDLSRRSLPSQIQLGFEAPEHDVHVQCDPDELSQVLLNLLLNARDALLGHHSDEPRIDVEIAPAGPAPADATSTAHARMRVSVTDNGPGMADHVKRRVFDPFFTTKGPTAGTGLGLAISWSVVRALGGTIECESVPDQGSSFHVYLPVSGADASEPEARPSSPLLVRPLSILLVDDDHFVRRVTKRALLRARHTVTEAASATEALSIAGQGNYDIVLLDQWLPDSCGTDIIDEMRLRTAGAKIVLFTGQEVDESTTRAADALLSKPMGARELLDTLASLMAGSTQGMRSGVPSAPPLRT